MFGEISNYFKFIETHADDRSQTRNPSIINWVL